MFLNDNISLQHPLPTPIKLDTAVTVPLIYQPGRSQPALCRINLVLANYKYYLRNAGRVVFGSPFITRAIKENGIMGPEI